MVTLGKQLKQVRVRTKVKWCLTLPVLDVEISSIRGQENGNGCTALLLRAIHHQSLDLQQVVSNIGISEHHFVLLIYVHIGNKLKSTQPLIDNLLISLF